MAERVRYFQGRRCCEGRAPVWDYLYEGGVGAVGGPLTDDEKVAISAVENYGGTFRAGHPPQLMPMEHTNLVNWNRPIFMGAADSWGAPFNRNLPRLNSFADLPSLHNPDIGPQNGLPHHQQTLDFQARERAKRVPFTNFRIVYNEATGQHRVQILWCRRCGPDAWEQFCSDLSRTFTEMVPVIRGIAMVCSYIPVFGTAVAFLINTTTSLVEGQSLDAAFLDGIGGALPGQPVSGMAFTAARSIIKGDRFDQLGIQTALAALPVDQHLQKVIGAAVEIAIRVARGDNLATAALDQIRAQLPDSAKKAMDRARRACNGENVGGMLSADAMAAARNAAAKGEGAVNAFVAQAGFQEAMDSIPPELRDAIKAGIVVGVIEVKNRQFIGTFGSVPERNVPANETHLQKGQRLIAAGAKYNGRLVSDILKGSSFAIAIEQFDALSGTWGKRTVTYKANGPFAANERPLTDAWRRGFTIALGACEGSSERGPGQSAVYQTMAESGGRDGFDAGQAVAWWRTKFEIEIQGFNATGVNASSAASRLQFAPATPPGSLDSQAQATAAYDAAIPRAFAIPRQEPLVTPPALDAELFRALAAKGQSIVRGDPLLAAMREREPDELSRIGFDVGVAIGDNDTAWGPGKQGRIDRLPAPQKNSAERAAHFAVERNARAEFALVGAAIAQRDLRPEIVSARAAEPPGHFTLGFDIATALFGSVALGGRGHTAQGPGSDAIRKSLRPEAIRGFDASVRLYMGR
ncbi:MAG: hypothetical protein ABIZ49_12490 [Opitutaceae bacterium]